MLNVAYIGFGNSVVRYHLPYVEKRENVNVKYIYRREIDRKENIERESLYPHITFTSNLEDIYSDELINLVVICSPDDSHFFYAKEALLRGKNILVEKPITNSSDEAKELFDLANENKLLAMVNQNRRLDTDFLTTKKVIESGILGDIVEIESHYDYFRPKNVWKNLGHLYGLGVHTIDQIISLLGIPDAMHFDVRSVAYPHEDVDDYFDIDLHYGSKTKAIIKTSYFVKKPYPRFIVHGEKGSFIKYGGKHNSDENASAEPYHITVEVEDESKWGEVSYIDDTGKEYNEIIKSEPSDYGEVYDNIHDVLFNNGEKMIKDNEVIAVLEVIESALQSRDYLKVEQ